MLDQSFSRRFTRNQASELDQAIKRFENFNMYGDENDHEPKGDVVNYALLTSIEIEPSNYDQACTNDLWVKAMEEEITSINKSDTWEIVELPKGKKHVGCEWVYKTKYNVDGSIERHKARLVAKGFTQRYDIDYEETFAPIVRQETIRLILSLVAHKGWQVNHMVVKSAFLNGYLDEEVYVQQPQALRLKGVKILCTS